MKHALEGSCGHVIYFEDPGWAERKNTTRWRQPGSGPRLKSAFPEYKQGMLTPTLRHSFILNFSYAELNSLYGINSLTWKNAIIFMCIIKNSVTIVLRSSSNIFMYRTCNIYKSGSSTFATILSKLVPCRCNLSSSWEASTDPASQEFITVSTGARHWSLSCGRWVVDSEALCKAKVKVVPMPFF